MRRKTTVGTRPACQYSLEFDGDSCGQSDADRGAQPAQLRDLLLQTVLQQEAECAASAGRGGRGGQLSVDRRQREKVTS